VRNILFKTSTQLLSSERALVCGCQMSATCDVFESKRIIDVTASLKMVWVEKQSGETFSFSGERK
jgi:hypothetical protein